MPFALASALGSEPLNDGRFIATERITCLSHAAPTTTVFFHRWLRQPYSKRPSANGSGYTTLARTNRFFAANQLRPTRFRMVLYRFRRVPLLRLRYVCAHCERFIPGYKKQILLTGMPPAKNQARGTRRFLAQIKILSRIKIHYALTNHFCRTVAKHALGAFPRQQEVFARQMVSKTDMNRGPVAAAARQRPQAPVMPQQSVRLLHFPPRTSKPAFQPRPRQIPDVAFMRPYCMLFSAGRLQNRENVSIAVDKHHPVRISFRNSVTLIYRQTPTGLSSSSHRTTYVLESVPLRSQPSPVSTVNKLHDRHKTRAAHRPMFSRSPNFNKPFRKVTSPTPHMPCRTSEPQNRRN